MFVGEPAESRRYFWQAWRKHQAGARLEPLEVIVVNVISQHPEYHSLFAGDERSVCEYGVGLVAQNNPFFHLGLHIALHEQLQSDRPAGIRAHYQRQMITLGDNVHAAEHRIMKILTEVLLSAQSKGEMPDEGVYLAELASLV
ncbi:MAG: DUF1841 family protein [Gammaproteobacteria bacterium]|nr:DUF1841 family protein [Gammaproteobacteria bacterium]